MTEHEELSSLLKDAREAWLKTITRRRSEDYIAEALLAAGYRKKP